MVFVVLDCVHSFWRFLYRSLKNVGQCHQNQLTFFLKWRWWRPKVFGLSCAWLVSPVVNEKVLWEVREINVRELIPIFVRLQCWLLPALVFECCVWYFGSLHPAFGMSWDIEYLKNSFSFFRKRGLRRCVLCAIVLMIFVQTSEKNWAISPKRKHKLSEMTLSTFQKCLFELCFAFFFGCN